MTNAVVEKKEVVDRGAGDGLFLVRLVDEEKKKRTSKSSKSSRSFQHMINRSVSEYGLSGTEDAKSFVLGYVYL